MNREVLQRPFADGLIKTRRGGFGQTISYVEGAEYIRRLNDALEGEWSFEVVEHKILAAEVVVLGSLTVGGVVKTAFGGSSITTGRETGEVVSIADDLKAAATDALKKASSLLGVGLHLYGESQPEAKPAGKARPRNGNGSAKGNGGQPPDRLTQRQLAAIWSMGRSLGQSAEALRERAVKVFGAQPEFLTKTDASSFISELGEALAGGNGATP